MRVSLLAGSVVRVYLTPMHHRTQIWCHFPVPLHQRHLFEPRLPTRGTDTTTTSTCFLLLPKPIKADNCQENKEYTQQAEGYVEISDKLFSTICSRYHDLLYTKNQYIRSGLEVGPHIGCYQACFMSEHRSYV